jgi:hypothetical protein
MKHFNEKRELVEGPPAEFWDDIEYMETMDVSYHKEDSTEACGQHEWRRQGMLGGEAGENSQGSDGKKAS